MTAKSALRIGSGGQDCALARRSVRGLLQAAVLGLALIGHDEQLQEAIRQQLSGAGGEPRPGRRRRRPSAPDALEALLGERRKLLTLHYAGQISAELFAQQEAIVTARIDAMRHEEQAAIDEVAHVDDVRARFDEIAAYLADIDVEAIWGEATELERRALIDELLAYVEVHDDHLEVVVRGAPNLNVTLGEVGLGTVGEDQMCRRGDLMFSATRFD